VREAGQELESLWAEVFGEPPSVTAAPSLLAEVLVAALPPAPPYAPASPEACRTPPKSAGPAVYRGGRGD
jgi:hypothetical protein